MKWFGMILLFLFNCSCGVRGDPQAPIEPTYIGRGRPTYQKAIQSLKSKKNDSATDSESEGWKEGDDFPEDSSK